MVLRLDMEALFCKIAQKKISSGYTVKAQKSRILYKQFVSHIELLKVKHCVILKEKCPHELFFKTHELLLNAFFLLSGTLSARCSSKDTAQQGNHNTCIHYI